MAPTISSGPTRTARALARLAAAAAVCALLAAGAYVFAVSSGSTRSVDPASLLALQDLALAARTAGSGDDAALGAIEQGARRLRELAANESGADWARDPRLARILEGADALVAGRAALANTAEASHKAGTLVPRMVEEMRAVAAGAPAASQAAVGAAADRFEARARSVQLDLNALASGASEASQAARRLADSSGDLALVVRGLQGADASLGLPRLTTPALLERLRTLASLQSDLAGVVRRAVAAAPTLPAAQAASTALVEDARALAASRARQAPDAKTGILWWPLGLAVLALVPIALMFRRFAELQRETERQRATAEAQRRESDRNQQAILRLLDELSSLADGDLTVQATVTEDITGAIADSINFAVEALRGLVTTINASAIHLEAASRQTQALSQHLAKSSGAQSKQIASASESIVSMASTTEEVSGNAERAADVARHSVDIAHKGGDAVRRTIDGMNTIRETIQETSKRIKRLGESSQEIGNIVELINDIAEQTNILALNASIQASMAGDSGRGFAVVADEVQRLAERAANATKQIEVLVRTIQTDTNEAVVSMERSTTDVVGGALLAENAGAALEEIEQVSNQIASLVQNISGSSRQQAAGAQNIARNMQVLKEISSQTAESTSATSQAIAKLAELSGGLRRSVAGFRLPGEAAAPGAAATSAASSAAPPSPAASREPASAPSTTGSYRKVSA
jgi:twitching motility protein PilJ